MSKSDSSKLALLRVVAMGGGFFSSLLATRLLLTRDGVETYALYSLIVSVLAALPFSDLGLGAAVVNGTSDFRSGTLRKSDYLALMSRTSWMLSGVAAAIATVTVILSGTSAWLPALNITRDQSISIACLTGVGVLLALSVPLGLGGRLLQGSGNLVRASFIGLSTTIIQLVCIAIVWVADLPTLLLSVGPALALVGTAILLARAGFKAVGLRSSELTISRARETFPTKYSILRLSLPYLAVTTLNSLGLQYDRVILSQVSLLRELAAYSFVAQFITATTSVIALVSSRLWQVYRTRRANGTMRRSDLLRDTLLYGATSLLAGIATCGLAAIVLPIVAGHEVTVVPAVYTWAVIYVAIWGASRPVMMLMQDSRGILWQLMAALPTAVTNVGLTVLLGSAWGAAGPFAASAFAIGTFGIVPLLIVGAKYVSRAPE